MGFTVAGVLIGLVPPIALGVLVDALVEYNDRPEAVVLTAVIAVAIILEAGAYIASDTIYARNASRLFRDVRVRMFAGARRRASAGEETKGLSSRFISDAETLERVTLSLLDSGTMLVVEFVSAMVVIALFEPWAAVITIPVLVGIWVVTRRTQEPTAAAGQHRQEELEAMTTAIATELEGNEPEGGDRFAAAADRVMDAEIRFGWLQALNLQGSGGLAKLGPIAVVVAAAFIGTHQVGTLITLYLLAQRVFWGFDGLVDLSLGTRSVRGGVARCFDLIDTPGVEASSPAGVMEEALK
jgi:ABC-type bacteriocin/lantibiotic exporter with double-glycine peptidase domain